MKKALGVVRDVVADVAKLRNKQLAAVLAGGIVAVVAHFAGADITAAEVAAGEVAVGTAAAAVEKWLAQIDPAPSVAK